MQVRPETAPLASCECGASWALLKCSVTIPNDHIFDERNIAIDPEKCGRSVYDAVPRGWSAKSRPRCELDKVIITLHLQGTAFGRAVPRRHLRLA